MEHPVSFEAVELTPEAPITISRVNRGPTSLRPERFAHLHVPHELVIFDKVSGMLSTDTASYRLADRSMVWLPSMTAHDFTLNAGAASWILIQYSNWYTVSDRDSQTLCATLTETDYDKVNVLAHWLEGAVIKDHLSEARRIIDLILSISDRSALIDGVDGPVANALAQFRPVLDHMRMGLIAPLALSDAAAMCGLSPSYFSRLFRKAFGHTFSSHMIQLRLKQAAMELGSTQDPIKTICFRNGFKQPAYFTAQFRRLYGQTPTEFRSQARHKGLS